MASLESATDRELERLSAAWPGWEFWVVPLAVGGQTWCARPAGAEVSRYQASSPAELEAKLATG
jgi:hypothetical protein